ncbi:HAMP domain-containing histidine kinase [Bifidobacterium callimiconis]|uniref:sensor histidine kinase n=1 Tax=Bifidobacterium callimiconis TaxID=2306973 RepID=UPI001BDC1D11|nr:HAMP domain-containing sensor histidine kinase [Bifidobacterium callimiconis]MBT1176043.1 HAMP domain-containing histidine kinase [Bifidobacterium callimiconis]
MSILGVLVVVFAGMIALIYGTSYLEVSRYYRQATEQYTTVYWEHGLPGDDGNDGNRGTATPDGTNAAQSAPSPSSAPDPSSVPDGGTPPDGSARTVRTFYAAVFDDNGDLIDAAGNANVGVTDDMLSGTGTGIVRSQGLAWSDAVSITGSPRSVAYGVSGQWVYRVSQFDGRTLVVLMDNTIMDESMGTLMRNTLVFGAVAIVLLSGIAIGIARHIVQPLEAAHDEQRRFIADAGHELKTPISAIGANAELLRRDLSSGGASADATNAHARQWLDNITFENQRMAGLVSRLLELDHVESRGADVTSVDFSRLVSGCLLSHEPVAFEHGFMIHDNIASNVVVDGDADRLGDLASILISNAIEHGDATINADDDADPLESMPTVDVRLHVERGRAMLRVSNPGTLTEHEAAHVFDRFYRADPARSSSGTHYGLGLSIARAIVHAYGGTIVCDCRKTSTGADTANDVNTVTFTVTLPLSKHRPSR